jgi:hypothetical protein
MDTLKAWFVTIIGILLILPLLGVSAIGTATSGIIGWVIALLVLIMGIIEFTKK